jgi:hypothetical protein
MTTQAGTITAQQWIESRATYAHIIREVLDLADDSNILKAFHAGNLVHDTEGIMSLSTEDIQGLEYAPDPDAPARLVQLLRHERTLIRLLQGFLPHVCRVRGTSVGWLTLTNADFHDFCIPRGVDPVTGRNPALEQPAVQATCTCDGDPVHEHDGTP